MKMIMPMKLPTIAQNGSTIPMSSIPRSNAMTNGTAGRIFSMLLVKSLNGNAKKLIGSGKNAPVIAGSAR